MSLSSFPASIEIRLPGVARLLLLIPVLLAILIGWFCLRWQVGATVSEVATAGQTPNLELARVAARWAPDDPFVHWQLGAATRREFTANTIQETLREFDYGVAAICGGMCSCATCHVYVAAPWLDRLPPMQGDEKEILQELESYRPQGSRLSCQLPFEESLAGREVEIAPEE